MSTNTAHRIAPDTNRRGGRDIPHRWRSRVIITAVAVLFAAVLLAAVIFLPPLYVGAVLLVASLIFLLRGVLFTWPAMLLLLAACIMFIPARRYALPIPLPFALEPYRVMIFVILIALAIAFLGDRTRRWRPIAFGWPLGIFLATLLVSFIANGTRLVEEGLVQTSLSGFFQLGILLSVFVSVRQLLTSERMVTLLLMFIVWSAVIVSFFAIVERVARFNVFWMLSSVLPLVIMSEDGEAARAGVNRAYGSAQHPIALAVMLCLVIPLIIYLAKYAVWPRNSWNRRIVYGIGTVLIFGGIVAAISRTAVVVLGVMFLVTLLMAPRVALLLVAFVFPLLLLAAAVVPAQVESMLLSFLDVDTLIASQYASAGMRGAGRLADLEPAMREVAALPFFGQGFGSRIVIGDEANSFILDNQVLGVLMEAGALGVAGYAAFMLAPPIMLIVFAYRSAAEPRHAALAAAIAIGIIGYSVSLFFFDAFGFFQTFFVHMMLLAIAAWLLTEAPRRDRSEKFAEAPVRAGTKVRA